MIPVCEFFVEGWMQRRLSINTHYCYSTVLFQFVEEWMYSGIVYEIAVDIICLQTSSLGRSKSLGSGSSTAVRGFPETLGLHSKNRDGPQFFLLVCPVFFIRPFY